MKTSADRPPMGATLGDDGADFRVWAPHAQSVAVIGTFNDWKPDADPMERDDRGCWRRRVAGARAGHEYRFLLGTPQGPLSRIDPYAREVTSSVGNGVIDDPSFNWNGDDFAIEDWNRLVIYELHIGTFGEPKDADDEFRPADFKSAARQLGHLKKLGVNAVEIMPVAEFAGDVSWGYNPAHVFAVESAYGGPKAFKTFIRECHRAGLAVILDVVYNHFGPSDIDLWRFDGWSENDKGGIYFYNDYRSETPWGSTRPDYGREEVRRFIVDNALYWMDEYHVDGLRLDMTVYIRSVGPGGDDIPEGYGLLQEINHAVKERHPKRITIAEDLQDNEWMTKDVGAGGAGFGGQWDARFVHPIRAVVTNPTDEGRSMSAVAGAIAIRDNDHAFSRVIYSESHDEVANGKARVPQEIDNDDPKGWYAQKRSTLAAALVFTAPGIPMLFQGQEFLEGEWFRDTVPVDWDSSDEFQGVVRLYRDLISLRLNQTGATGGLCGQHVQILHVNETDKLIAFRRNEKGGPGDDVVVAANFSHVGRADYVLGFPAPGRWRVRFNSDWSGYGKSFKGLTGESVEAVEGDYDGMPCQAKVAVAPYSVIILSQDPS